MTKLNSKKIAFVVFLLLALSSVHVLPAGADDKEEIDFANGLFERGMYDMAISEYRQFIDKNPESSRLVDAVFGVAESLFFQKEYQKAIAAYRDFINKFPTDATAVTARIRLAQVLLIEKDYAQVAPTLEAIEDASLDVSQKQQKYLYLAQGNYALGDLPIAKVLFGQAASIGATTPFGLEARFGLGQTLLDIQEYTQAEETFTQIYDAGKTDDVKSLALYNKGQAVFLRGDYNLSVDIFKQLIKDFPNEDIVQDAISNLMLALFNIPAYNAVVSNYDFYQAQLKTGSAKYNTFFIVANSHSQLQEYAQAIAFIDQALAVQDITSEEKIRAQNKKSEFLYLAKRYDEAINMIDQSLAQTSEDTKPELLFFKAESLYGLKKYEEALKAYQLIIDSYPDSEFAQSSYYGIAHSYNALGSSEESVKAFEKYSSLTDDTDKKKESLFNQILLFRQSQQMDKAIASAKQFLTEYTEDVKKAEVMFLLGNLYSDSNQGEAAIEIFEQYVALEGVEDKQQATFLLAYNFQISGQLDKALEKYSEVALNDKDKQLYYSAMKNRALIYLNQDKSQKAEELFTTIISEYPDNDLSVDTYLWLSENYLREKAYDKILAILDKAKDKSKTEFDKQGIAYFKAASLKEQEQCEGALGLFDVIISSKEKTSFTAESMIGKAHCLIAQKKFEEAKSLLDQVLLDYTENQSVSMKARFEMANYFKSQEKLDEASKHYMIIAVLYNDQYYCAESLYQAGGIFEKLEKKEEAKNTYREIIQVYQTSHRLSDAQERLTVLSETKT